MSAAPESKPDDRQSTYVIVRNYVILGLGVGLVLFGLFGGMPAVLTLGGGLVGFNPVARAAM